MSREKIYEKDLGYSILKPIVDWSTTHSYRKIEVVGKENIPSEGAVIIAPNHCNTLMDALVILRAGKTPGKVVLTVTDEKGKKTKLNLMTK